MTANVVEEAVGLPLLASSTTSAGMAADRRPGSQSLRSRGGLPRSSSAAVDRALPSEERGAIPVGQARAEGGARTRTAGEISAAIGLAAWLVEGVLEDEVGRGRVERVGDGYRLSEAGRRELLPRFGYIEGREDE